MLGALANAKQVQHDPEVSTVSAFRTVATRGIGFAPKKKSHLVPAAVPTLYVTFAPEAIAGLPYVVEADAPNSGRVIAAFANAADADLFTDAIPCDD